jgi:tetratricopeptide (TPR) repeat protein
MGFAQDRGTDSEEIAFVEGQKRALVIGISEYSSESLKLKVADNDARLFRDYLSNVEKIPDKDIAYLENEQANATSISNELEKLLNVSGKGDEIYIYFAGHGDVVKKYNRDTGFLLAYDANAGRNYFGVGGVIPLEDLNLVVNSITEKEAKVILVLDACHSGFAHEAGAKNNLKTLSNNTNFQFATKLLSCAPNQVSKESLDLGHGYFTYYLVLGLMGAADIDVQDHNLIYDELKDYLNTSVKGETNNLQGPRLITQDDYEIFKTIKPENKKIALEIENDGSQLRTAIANARGVRSSSKTNDEVIDNELYSAFNSALRDKNYFGSNTSALEVLNEAQTSTAISEDIKNRMRFSLVQKLSTSANLLINTYTSGAAVLPKGSVFRDNAKYLQICLELLGKDNLQYQRFYTSQLFLEAYTIIRNKKYAEYPKAKTKLKEAIALEPKAAYIHNALGVIYNYEENYSKSLKHHRLAAELIPTWSYPVNSIGNNYLDKYEFNKAIDYYNLALKLNSDNATPYNNLGVVNDRMNSAKRAEEYYLKVLKFNPNNVTTLINLGYKNKDKGNIKEALKLFERAIQLDSTYVRGYYAMSQLILDEHLSNLDARTYLDKAIDLEPYYAKGYDIYGDYYRRYIKSPSAIQKADSLYKIAEKLDPHYADSYYGQALTNQKDNDKGLKHLLRGIEINPDRITPLYNTAVFYENNLDNENTAITYYNKVLDLNPYHLPSYKQLIKIKTRANKKEEAFALSDSIIGFNSNSPDAYNIKGNLFFMFEDYKKAISCYNTAIQLDSTFTKSYVNLAYSYLQLDEFKKARIHYIKANELNPYKHKLSTFNSLITSKSRTIKTTDDSNEKTKLLETSVIDNPSLKSNFNLAKHYYLIGDSEKAKVLCGSILTTVDSKSWAVKFNELAIKIHIDLGNIEKAKFHKAAFLKSSSRINPIIEVLLLKLDNKINEAKAKQNAIDALYLRPSYLEKTFSKQSIDILNTI